VGNITLIGFMGTGKSEVGRAVARDLGMEFVDCDALIEQRTGLTVGEIFQRAGEERFRRLERREIARVSRRWGLVVGTGGGAPKDPANIEALKRAGLVICLTARPDVIWERTQGAGVRPLLAVPDPRARIGELLQERRACYEQADRCVDTSDCAIGDAAQAVVNIATGVTVDLGPRSYRIIVRPGALDEIGAMASGGAPPFGGLRAGSAVAGAARRAAIVGNPQVLRRYAARVRASLADCDITAVEIAVPAGERHKNLRRLGTLLQDMLAAGLDRTSVVIALGGGVIGDLAGFAAATYMRGIPYVQAPTSLLAQVDSAVGGKVAVDLPQGKNLAGAFYQPAGVAADLGTLQSLPARELRQGFAEVVKHGVVADRRFFEYLEQHRQPLAGRHPAVLLHVVRRSCEIKADIVSRDETERASARAILNYGHTFAHALETWGGYRKFRHGDAVAIGMVAAARVAVNRGWLPAEDAARIRSLLSALRLPVTAPAARADELIAIMAADKKARGGKLSFILPRAIGEVEVADDVTPQEIAQALAGGA
jgi:3-dehydroquinate synthase